MLTTRFVLFVVRNFGPVWLRIIGVMRNLHNVSKNDASLASCSFNKHGLILIILGEQHEHTFRNYMHILLTLFGFKQLRRK